MRVCGQKSLLVGCVLCGALIPSPTEAGLLTAHGETIAHVSTLSAEQQANAKNGHSAVGYKYDFAEVLWVKLWTWGGEWCLYNSQDSKTISSWQAADHLGIDKSDLTKPFFYKFPPGVLVLAGLFALTAGFKILRPERKRIQRLFFDHRYQAAISMMQDTADRDGDGGFSQAVQYLKGEGVPQDVAQRNLDTMVRALIAHPHATNEALASEAES